MKALHFPNCYRLNDCFPQRHIGIPVPQYDSSRRWSLWVVRVRWSHEGGAPMNGVGWYFSKSHKTAWLLSLLSAHVRTRWRVSSLQPIKGAPHISADLRLLDSKLHEISVALFSSPNRETVCKKTIEGEKKSKSVFSTKHVSFHNPTPACFSNTSSTCNFRLPTFQHRTVSSLWVFANPVLFAWKELLPTVHKGMPSKLSRLGHLKPYEAFPDAISYIFFFAYNKDNPFCVQFYGFWPTYTYIPTTIKIQNSSIISSKITCTPLQSTVSPARQPSTCLPSQ